MKKLISIMLSTIISILALTSCANTAISDTVNTSGTQNTAQTSATYTNALQTSNTTQTSATTALPPVIKHDYVALLYDFTDGGISLGKDIDLRSQFVKKIITPHAKLTIDGKTYQGVYDRSWNSKFYNFNRDEYIYTEKSENEQKVINYAVNADTGKVESYIISIYGNDSSNYEGREIYSQEECAEIAIEYMKEYIPNIEKYKLVHVSSSSGLTGYDILYDFKFAEHIGDMPIPNDLLISVNKYGDIIAFDYHIGIEDVEKFKESMLLESQDWDAIEEVVAKRACEAFTATDEFHKYFDAIRYDPSKSTKTLVRMKDGRYALQCQAYTFQNLKDMENAGRYYSVLILVYLE